MSEIKMGGLNNLARIGNIKRAPLLGWSLVMSGSLLSLACANVTGSQAQEAIKSEIESETNISNKLKIPKLDSLQIPYEVYQILAAPLSAKLIDNPNDIDEDPVKAEKKLNNVEDRTMTQVRFGSRLSESQFDQIKKAYNPESDLRYIANFGYTLGDFLGPLLQATEGYRFSSQVAFGTKKLTKFMATNCWGTVYEFLRNDPSGYDVNYIPAEKVEAFFASPQYFDVIPEDQAQTGDILALWAKQNRVDAKFANRVGELVHVTIKIDDTLYYDKANPLSASLYRFVPLTGYDLYRSSTTRSYLRFKKENQLPRAQNFELFSSLGFLDVSPGIIPPTNGDANNIVGRINYKIGFGNIRDIDSSGQSFAKFQEIIKKSKGSD